MILRRTAFALLAFIASMANAQQPSAPPALVSTSGTAVLRVVPDLADIQFEVEIRNFDLGIARQKQAERLVKVLAALRTAEVAEAELQSSHVQISPNYTEDRSETEKVRFYSVSQTISCTVRDLKRLPDVIAAAVAAGVTSVNRATFRTSELPKHRAEARIKAIRVAKEKAIALAAELGAKIGKPHTINESGSYSGAEGNVRFNMNSIDAAAEGEGSATFAPGTIAVSETIHVSFVLE